MQDGTSSSTSLDSWFRTSGLKVNAEKTQLMLLGSAQNLRNAPNITVKFRDHTLIPVSEAKNLGITFDRTLSWNTHVTLVVRRCFGILSGISHLRGAPTIVCHLRTGQGIGPLASSLLYLCIWEWFEKEPDPDPESHKLRGKNNFRPQKIRSCIGLA